jgi:hypothetical protein
MPSQLAVGDRLVGLSVIDLLTGAALAFFGGRLAMNAGRVARSRPARRRTVEIVRGLRPHHFLQAPPVFVVVIATALLLVQVPGLSFGWWTALGGTGNIITGSTTRTGGTALAWIIPAAFLVVVAPLLPLFAEREEQMFRVGAEGWSTARRARRGVEFGLLHLIMGIPIGVALALSVGGWYFTWAYLSGWRRGGQGAGLLESTRSHLAYNAEILLVVAALLVAYGRLS